MTKNAMERLVEDLISESMAKGNVYQFIILNFGNMSENVFPQVSDRVNATFVIVMS